MVKIVMFRDRPLYIQLEKGLQAGMTAWIVIRLPYSTMPLLHRINAIKIVFALEI